MAPMDNWLTQQYYTPSPTVEALSTAEKDTSLVLSPNGSGGVSWGTGMPSGAILDYAGSSAPTGWLLCDGSAVSRTTYATLFGIVSTTYGSGDGSTTFNLPDLRGRVTAGKDNMGGSAASRLTSLLSGVDGATLGASGGEETHTLVKAEMPSHDHGAATGNGGSHQHIGNVTDVVLSPTGTGGSHSHTGATGGPTGSADWDVVAGAISIPSMGHTHSVSSDGSHSHTVSRGTTSHTHDLIADHNHSIASDGSDGAHQNTQPTLVLNKIIKT